MIQICSTPNLLTGCKATRDFYSKGTAIYFLALKGLGRETDLSPPDDDNVQNAWNYTSTSPTPSWHVPGIFNFDSNISSHYPTENKPLIM